MFEIFGIQKTSFAGYLSTTGIPQATCYSPTDLKKPDPAKITKCSSFRPKITIHHLKLIAYEPCESLTSNFNINLENKNMNRTSSPSITTITIPQSEFISLM